MANLVRDIVSSVWMMRPSEANSMLPLVNSFLSGKTIDFSSYVVTSNMQGYRPQSDTGKRVVVIDIIGVIMKYDYCGDMGMLTFERMLNEIKEDPTIGALVLNIDSGGGEATHMHHVAVAMREFVAVKPILVHYAGYCCSAAYYIASQATKIYASGPTDIVGSIGTMWAFWKPNENSTDGFELRSVYATLSTKKNYAYEQAQIGNEEPMKTEALDPFNSIFHDDVKQGRPNMDASVYTGIDVMTDEAIQLGFIDGVKRLEEVITEALELANQ